VASIVAGISWIATLSSLNVSAQYALPAWVRGRGLAIYVTTLFGSMALGSIVWGEVASTLRSPIAHHLAAGGALFTMALTWR
jgi:hypothetical protein